jgi:hypothetical protein
LPGLDGGHVVEQEERRPMRDQRSRVGHGGRP